MLHRSSGRAAVLLLLLGACSCPSKSRAPTAGGKPVARLVLMQGGVHYRPAAVLVWQSAVRDMPLYHRDALKTAAGARARVVFTSGAELEVDEQSLVIIEAEVAQLGAAAAEQVARLGKGTLRGVIKPGGAPVKVLAPDGTVAEITARAGHPVPFQVRAREGNKLEVTVLRGAATVRAGAQEVRLDSRQVTEISGGRVAAPISLLSFPELIAPPVDARVEAGAQMELRWAPVEKAAMYRVQLSHLTSFDERLYDTTVVVPFFQLPAPKARRTYVWRVASVDARGHESEFGYARRFHVESSAPAVRGQLLAPPNNTGLQHAGAALPVLFRWKGTAKIYELVVARVPDLQRRVVARRRTAVQEAEVRGLSVGEYYWGVYALDGPGRAPIFEVPYRLIIARREPPEVKVPKTINWK